MGIISFDIRESESTLGMWSLSLEEDIPAYIEILGNACKG